MKKAILKTSFSMVQWLGIEYSSYEEDAECNTFQEGEEVLVLHEAEPNPMGRLYVIFSERLNESAVVSESYLEMKE